MYFRKISLTYLTFQTPFRGSQALPHTTPPTLQTTSPRFTEILGIFIVLWCLKFIKHYNNFFIIPAKLGILDDEKINIGSFKQIILIRKIRMNILFSYLKAQNSKIIMLRGSDAKLENLDFYLVHKG